MDTDYFTVSAHLVSALIAGGIIGMERGFHGRPAGSRTHALVCMASSLLMLITAYQWEWLSGTQLENIQTDPTRMAQGIMTGIGFLGAGVIFKERFSIRGLTTAASIWITSAIGIIIGAGFYFAAVLATLLTLITLSVFRWLEAKMPAYSYAHHSVRFARDDIMSEEQIKNLLTKQGFSISSISYGTAENGAAFEYKMTIRTTELNNTSRLADSLSKIKQVREFRISPTGD